MLTQTTRIDEQRRATLICEEIEHGCNTFSRDLAGRQGRYANVDMPVAERDRRGIPQGYSDPGASYTPEQVEKWHCAREQFMVERLIAEQQDKHEATLFICGRLHGERLAAILRARGLEVAVIDLADQDCFSDSWEIDSPFLD